jgi:peptidoglycan hydrolase CwlO-like protein
MTSRCRSFTHLRTILISFLAVIVAASCARKDNSADTDQASHDLRKAQAAVSEKREHVATNEVEVEGKRRALIKEQQDLVDQTKSLEDHRQQLAKLDAALAGLATHTDATSRDAVAGLHARRDLLAAKLAAMPIADDPGWAGFTQDVDTIFDAIERDLRATK